MSNQAVAVYAEALKRQKQETEESNADKVTSKSTRKLTRTATSPRGVSREPSRTLPRDQPRETPRSQKKARPRTGAREVSRKLPTRDEIQEFTFRLRDELRVKVQAEVPPHWHGELEEIARELDVKKLELYRFIIGEFLGKVKRKHTP